MDSISILSDPVRCRYPLGPPDGIIELLVQFGEFCFSIFRGDFLLFGRSASQHDERISASADVEKSVYVGLEATLTDSGSPNGKIFCPCCRENCFCFATSSMESIKFSPDATRHGGFSIPQELVANEWRSPPLPSRTRLFPSEPRNTCACPPNTNSTPLKTNWM